VADRAFDVLFIRGSLGSLMAEFKVVIADPESGETFQREVDGQDANRFLGREIGDEVTGDAVGLSEHTIAITGGSDETGRPMREDVSGTRLKELLLEGGVGFKPSREGERKRITVRGREIDNDVAQINVSVVEGDDVAAALGEGDDGDEE
jgi:small subunit ribosomal protein S6e